MSVVGLFESGRDVSLRRKVMSFSVRFSVLFGASVVLAACGSDDSAGGAAVGGSSVVSSQTNPDLGTILVDSSGRTVYFADEEANGDVRCVDDCLDFWTPVAAGTSTAAGGDDLGVVHRRDNNQDQVSYQGKPLYTFKLDKAAGDVTGDNVKDSFGGTTFRWHAVVLAGNGGTSQPDGGGGGGY